MAICNWCKKDMLLVDGCSGNAVVEYPDGEDVPSIPFDPPRGVLNCGDCGVLPGQSHHPGCDNEICPRCDGQLIACGCLDDEDELDDEEEMELVSQGSMEAAEEQAPQSASRRTWDKRLLN